MFIMLGKKPVLGGSHFLWEPADSGSLMMLLEPDRFSNIYNFSAGENRSGCQVFIFLKLTRVLK